MISADRVRAILAELRKLPFIALYVGDWLKDPIAGCTLTAQMLWARMMFVMHEAPLYGHLVDAHGRPLQEARLIRLCGARTAGEYRKALAELHAAGVPSETGDEAYRQLLTAEINGEEVDLSPMRTTEVGVIYSRRMVRDHRLRVIRRLVGQLGAKSRNLVDQTESVLVDQTLSRARVGVRAETEIDLGSQEPILQKPEGVQGEGTRPPPKRPDFAAVERISAKVDASALKTKPSLQIVTAWLSEYDEALILETLYDCEPAYAGKHYQYLERILTTRRDNPDQRPGNRRAKGNGNGRASGSNGNGERGSGTASSAGPSDADSHPLGRFGAGKETAAEVIERLRKRDAERETQRQVPPLQGGPD
jgi:hypothetical protein